MRDQLMDVLQGTVEALTASVVAVVVCGALISWC